MRHAIANAAAAPLTHAALAVTAASIAFAETARRTALSVANNWCGDPALARDGFVLLGHCQECWITGGAVGLAVFAAARAFVADR